MAVAREVNGNKRKFEIRMNSDELRKLKIRLSDEHLDTITTDDLFGRLNIHGVSDFYNATGICSRVFWMLVLIACVALLSTGIYHSVAEYTSGAMRTTQSFQMVDKMDVPDLYVCPTNFVDNEKKNKNEEAYVKVRRYIQFYYQQDLSQTKFRRLIRTTPFTLTNYNKIMNRLSFDAHQIFKLKEEESGMKRPGNVQKLVDKRHGICYLVKSNYSQTRPGVGVRYVLDMNVKNFIPSIPAMTEGAFVQVGKISVGGQSSLLVHPGRYVRIGLGLKKVKLLDKTAGRTKQLCKSGGHEYRILDGGVEYTEANCREDCYLSSIKTNCSCIPPLDLRHVKTEVGKVPVCPVEDPLEQFPCHKSQHSLCNDIEFKDCTKNCEKACESSEYHQHHSSMTLGSYGARQALVESFQFGTCKGMVCPPGSIYNVTAEELAQSILVIDLSFDHLEYTSLEQIHGRTLTELIADIGGQMGLYLGASVLSLVQMKALLCGWLCTRWTRKRTTELPV